MKRTNSSIVVLVVSLVVMWMLSAQSAGAATIGGWKWKADAEAEFAYETNVYHLSNSQADRLDANTAADQTSGRFTNMESVGDFIITPEFKAKASVTGMSGRELQVSPWINYVYHMKNTERNHFGLGVDLDQEVTDVDTVSFSFDYAPGVFSKNYLSDAVVTATLVVTDAERRYSAGTHDDTSFEVAWRRRLDADLANVKKLYGEINAGYSIKRYESPFSHRDEDTYSIGAAVDIELVTGVEVSFSYDFDHVDVPVASEVLIRDEPDFGVSLNDVGSGATTTDSDTIDNNVRIVSTVDRSRNEHTFGIKMKKKVNDTWDGYAKYDLRFQNYDSKEPYDITRQDRSDVRHRIGLGAERELADRLSLSVGWLWAYEKAGRDALAAVDPTESKSYSDHTFSALLSYSL